MLKKNKTHSGVDVIRLNSFKNERKIQPRIKFNLETVKGCSPKDKRQLIISTKKNDELLSELILP